MGMFDNIHINSSMLPVTDEEEKLFGKSPDWQTKSLDCTLDDYYITDDNLLKVNRYDSRWNETKEGHLSFLGVEGCLVRENEHLETIAYHGFIDFYSSFNGNWYEFKAKFTDGKLIEITGGIKRETEI